MREQLCPIGGRRLVIGDIHGCSRTLRRLLHRLGLRKEDLVVFVGDYIDKGPDNVGVIDIVSSLETVCHVVPLRGNHEEIFLRLVEGDSGFVSQYGTLEESCVRMKAMDLLGDVIRFYNWMSGLRYFIDLGDVIISHAGFNPDDPIGDKETMVGLKSDDPNTGRVLGKRVVHGHAPKTLSAIIGRLCSGHPVINIDNGIVKDKPEMGSIVCLDIDSNEVYIQERLD